MDQGRENAVGAVTRAAELAADADDALHRADEREREHADRDDEFDQVKQALDDVENADTSKGRDLNGGRVGEIRSLLAEGGDQAVAKKFGESALGSPETTKAKAQRASIRRHERDLAQRAHSDAVVQESNTTTAHTDDTARLSMREQAMERYRQSEQDRERERGSLGR